MSAADPAIRIREIATVGEHLRLDGVGEVVVDDIVVGYPLEETPDGLAPNEAQLVTRIHVVREGECIVMGLAGLEERIENGVVQHVPHAARDGGLHDDWQAGLLL